MPPFETFFNKAVKDCMRTKFYTLKADDTVATAVKVTKDNNLGSVGVQFGSGPVGIVTDGDIVMKVVSVSGNPAKVKLQDIAMRNPVTIQQDASLEEAFRLMCDEGFLGLIVVDDRDWPAGLLVERYVFAASVSELLGDREAKPSG